MKKLVVICGPTGSGKSELAMLIAERLGGEIVGADSMQIYKYMDIGTAKPDFSDRARVPHHMVDFLEPGESYSCARYARDAGECVEDILSRGRIPVVCGGTGLYIDALLKGDGFRAFDPALRQRLEGEWELYGGEAMLERVALADPEAAARMSENDRKRIIRALEMIEGEGVTPSEHNRASSEVPKKYDACVLGLLPEPREYLYSRIDARAKKMFQNGLLDETMDLLLRGALKGTACQAIGYKEVLGVFSGELGEDEALELLQRKSRNYAKRQITWFKKTEGIRWIKYQKDEPFTSVFQSSTAILRERGIE